MSKFENIVGLFNSYDEPWDGKTGMAVEDFITRKLAASEIIGMEYADSKLTLQKADGSTVKTEITVEPPTYDYGVYIYGLRITDAQGKNSNTYIASDSTVVDQYLSGKKYEVGLAIYATASTSISTSDKVGTVNTKIEYGSKSKNYNVVNIDYTLFEKDGLGNVTGLKISDTTLLMNTISWVDITELFTTSQNSVKITATIQEKDAPVQRKYTLNRNITVEVLELSYLGGYVNLGNAVYFLVKGGSGTYKLQVFNNKTEDKNNINGLTYLGLKPGLNQLVVRAINETNTGIYTDWLYLNIINTENFFGNAVAINEVRKSVNNNGIATLYKLHVYSYELDNITIKTYLEPNPAGTIPNPKTDPVKYDIITASLYKNNVYETSYQKYMELSGNNNMFLLINVDGAYYDFYNVSTRNSVVSVVSSKSAQMTVEPLITNFAYFNGTPPKYSFDQIVGASNNIFVTKDYDSVNYTISEDIEPSNGWFEEGGRTLLRLTSLPNPILRNPINLGLQNTFSIELGFKTKNISNKNKPIFTLGNFQLRPTQLCWWTDAMNEDDISVPNTSTFSTFTARNSLFLENVETHVIITVTADWKNSNDIYPPKDLFPSKQMEDAYNNYMQSNSRKKNNIVRIFINGVIDREYFISDDEYNEFSKQPLVINPTTADIDFYLFRVYDGIALNYNQIQQNYISFLPEKTKKEDFYNKNDILKNGVISYERCQGKYNTLLLINPKGIRVPNITWKIDDPTGDEESDLWKSCGSTLFLNYANPATNSLYGGRINHGRIKGQGSSAKKYLWWNLQFDLNKLKKPKIDPETGKEVLDEEGKVVKEKINSEFRAYSTLKENNTFNMESEPLKGCYYMPPYADQTDLTPMKYKKLVGKINFASSMQSHKQGACKLYDDAYKSLDDLRKNLYSGGRKAVHEEAFLYFYWDTDLEDVSNIQPSDIEANLDKIKFAGFQTFGPGKGDDACSGHDEDLTPGYLLLEGAENGDPSTNFRVPWHALQRGNDKVYGSSDYVLTDFPTVSKEVSLASPWDKLYAWDGSITYNDPGHPAWDIEFGADDIDNGFNVFFDEAKESLKVFRTFYDLVYKYSYNFDVDEEATSPQDSWDKTQRYAVTLSSFFLNGVEVIDHESGDMYRYEEYSGKWVKAGLYYDLNNKDWERLNIYNLALEFDEFSYDIQLVKNAIKYGFQSKLEELDCLDITDVAFHQAFIKFLSGTDNRAKNSYYQIIGPLYQEVEDGEGGTKLELAEKWDRKIRLIGDDLDTIMVTDNNGLQSKPYNLLEESYDESMHDYWGDANNQFFKMFDQCYEDNIKRLLANILTKCNIDSSNILSPLSYLYKVFFSVQETYPAVAYNHVSKLWYENALEILQSKVISVYENNKINNPISQSHGSCLLCEAQFIKERNAFLSGYAQVLSDKTSLTVKGDSGGNPTPLKIRMEFEPYQDIYPNYYVMTPKYLNICLNNTDPFDEDYSIDKVEGYNSIKRRTLPGKLYTAYIDDAAINQGIYFTDYMKSLKILGLQSTELAITGDRITSLHIDNNEMDDHPGLFTDWGRVSLPNGIASTSNLPVLQDLILRNIVMGSTLDCSRFNKLVNIDLSGSTTNQVIFPETGTLQTITIPAIKIFKIYNNPGLTEVNIADVSNIKEVYIDCAKCGTFDVAAFLESLIDNELDSVDIRNANNLALSEEIIKHLLGCNFNITGKLKIVEIPGSSKNKNIAFNTKQALVNKFGNIDSTDNKLFVEYQKTTVTSISGPAEVSVFGTFNTPINGLFPVTITSGNNVEILNEENPYNPAVTGRLNISYACAKISGNEAYNTIIKDFNQKTGAITINKESETFIAKVTITVNGKYTHEITVKFAWKAPGVGDFAYVDGTFSSGYDRNKTLAGLVYATKADSDTEGTAYIIGAEYTSDTPYYLGYSQENISQDTDVNKVVFDRLNNYLDTKGIKNYDIVVFNPSQIIDKNALIAVTGSYYSNYQEGYDTRDLSHFLGNSDTLSYVNHVNTLLGKLGNDGVNNMTVENGNTRYIENMDNLNTLCKSMANYLNLSITSGGSQKYINQASALLFPYFYSAYLYTPAVSPNEVIVDDYKQGKWYVPSFAELVRIIYYAGYSIGGEEFTLNRVHSEYSNAVIEDLGGNEVKTTTELGITTISSDPFKVPIFSLALDRMQDDIPTIWKKPINKLNTCTTVDTNLQENFSYLILENTGNTSWVSGQYTNSWGATNQLYMNAWRFTPRQCVPHVQCKYRKP